MTKKFTALLLALLLTLSVAAAAETLPSDLSERPHLDYDRTTSWCFLPEGDAPADLFFIAPLVDMGKDGNLLADAENEKFRSNFAGALNMELGIYSDACAVYAPYYQQITFPVYSMTIEEREPYLQYAYEDVRLAFEAYLTQCDPTRPLVLAGFSQGADMIIRLMKDYFDDEALSARLVAAYAIGWRVTEEELAAYPQLRMAQGETDTGVIVSFNSESEATADSMMVPEGTRTYGINPLNWSTDSTPADASLNLGACFTDYSGAVTEEIPAFCGAYLDAERGTLKVPGIDDEAYPGKLFPNGVYHLYDYQFFYRNLQKNVQDRVNAYLAAR